MSMATCCTLALSLLGGNDVGQWVMEGQSSGAPVYWTSETSVRTDATFYHNYFDILDVQAWVSYIGFEFGPFDVIDMIDDTDYEALTFGPLPANFPDRIYITPDPPEDMSMMFTFLTHLDADGHMNLGIEDIKFGTAEYDLGWPFGVVTVNLEQVYLAANITITASDDLCIGDTNGDGIVDTDDVLAVIGGWGECPTDDEEDCPGDCDRSWAVDVSDLLWVISQFGDCP